MATPTSFTSGSSAGDLTPNLAGGIFQDASVAQLATGRAIGGSCPTTRPSNSQTGEVAIGGPTTGAEHTQSDEDLQRAVSAVVRGTPHDDEQVPRRRSRMKTAPAAVALQRLEWADPNACANLTAILLADRRSEEDRLDCRRNAATALCAQLIAPFLRFDEPLKNMLYVFGGRNQKCAALDIVEMLDTWHGRWVRCPPLPRPRVSATASVLPDGRLMVIGGYDDRGMVEGLLASCEIFDPRTNSWAPEGGPSLKRYRWGHGSATMNGKIFVVGGCSLTPHSEPSVAAMETLRSCEVYDPETGIWSEIAPLCIARSGARVVNAGGYIIVVGGCDDIFGREEHLMSVEIYDPEADRWSLLAQPLQKPRPIAGVAALTGGADKKNEVLIVGGASALSSVEIYDVKPSALQSQADSEGDGESTATGGNDSQSSSSSSNRGSDNDSSSSSSDGTDRLEENSSDNNTSSNNSNTCTHSNDNNNNNNTISNDNHNNSSSNNELAAARPALAEARPRAKLPNAPEGRMGCQAANLLLPNGPQNYPLNNRPSVVIVGGEIWGSPSSNERPAKRRDFSRILVWDVETSTWRADSVVPPMPTARTAVAICVGEGFVRQVTPCRRGIA